jgi:hypothetical protein
MDERTRRIAVIAGVTLLVITLIAVSPTVWVSGETVKAPKTGVPVTLDVETPGGEYLDTVTVRYTGGPYQFVQVSTTDMDESVTSEHRTSKVWINDRYHLKATWVRSTDTYVEVRLEVGAGAMAIWPQWLMGWGE